MLKPEDPFVYDPFVSPIILKITLSLVHYNSRVLVFATFMASPLLASSCNSFPGGVLGNALTTETLFGTVSLSKSLMTKTVIIVNSNFY